MTKDSRWGEKTTLTILDAWKRKTHQTLPALKLEPYINSCETCCKICGWMPIRRTLFFCNRMPRNLWRPRQVSIWFTTGTLSVGMCSLCNWGMVQFWAWLDPLCCLAVDICGAVELWSMERHPNSASRHWFGDSGYRVFIGAERIRSTHWKSLWWSQGAARGVECMGWLKDAAGVAEPIFVSAEVTLPTQLITGWMLSDDGMRLPCRVRMVGGFEFNGIQSTSSDMFYVSIWECWTMIIFLNSMVLN